MAVENEARIWGVVGASGTGKGVWEKAQLRKLQPARFVAWDFKREYLEFTRRVRPSLAAVRSEMVKAGPAGPARISYCPVGSGEKSLRREFEGLCELVYAWENCVFLCSELAMVTTPGWAPGAWRQMTTSGRHGGIHIIGDTQTPALVDKTFLGNCTLLHAGPLREYAHRQAVARCMDIEEQRLAALVKFQWLEKDFDTGQVTTGYTYPPGFRAAGNAAAPGLAGRKSG